MKHQMCEQRYFDDFEVGEKFILPSRTMTDALFAAFQLAELSRAISASTVAFAKNGR